MGKRFNPKASTKNIGILITTIVFALIGAILIIVGFYNNIVSWLMQFGIVLLVIAFPIILFIIYRIIMNKIEGI